MVKTKIHIIKAPGNRRHRPTISASVPQSEAKDIHLQRILTTYRIDGDRCQISITLFTGDLELITVVPEIPTEKRQTLRDCRPANGSGMTGQDTAFQKFNGCGLLITETHHEVKSRLSGTSRSRGETGSQQKSNRGNQSNKPCAPLHNS
ncbi:MAG: hypothetical protein CMN04_00650 [Roseibacillus sp.]|nr:hypothetical protein [Roseibacillus sp.]